MLGFSRWIEYKRLDLVIRAGEELGKPVVIAGSGPLESRLRELAGAAAVPVLILRKPSDVVVRELMRRASVLVFPAVEDFGIVPVESQAAGTPVVAPRAGGALDTVIDGVTGTLVDSLTAAELASGVERASPLAAADCRANAERFSYHSFAARFREWVGF
ncbi:glycosyltransferase [Blastococcus sp. PRF04-17]|uniref:glycosyltransferase n=1 Tax=Blastococcus sp. PRF04-17 TaxID=2933797 RepID=UPI003530332E